jgi:hypothetical protein
MEPFGILRSTMVKETNEAPLPTLRDLTAARREALQALEDSRKAKVIVYVTADRPAMANLPAIGAKIGLDVFRCFYDQLEHLGPQKRLDLFLYTTGGVLLTPLRLVHLLREYCTRLSVLIPHKAHSAGTLIALGADEIIMGKMGELSPVDPQTIESPAESTGRALAVEDVTAYLNLAREQVQQGMSEAFQALTQEIHPTRLGHIMRQHSLIRLLIRRLLSLHMEREDDRTIEEIVELMTEGLCAHDYLISRREAQNIPGLKVKNASADTERALWSAYRLYEDQFQLRKPIDFEQLLAGGSEGLLSLPSAAIETTDLSYLFIHEVRLRREGDELAIDVRGSWQALDADFRLMAAPL